LVSSLAADRRPGSFSKLAAGRFGRGQQSRRLALQRTRAAGSGELATIVAERAQQARQGAFPAPQSRLNWENALGEARRRQSGALLTLSRGWKKVAVSDPIPTVEREYTAQADRDARVGVFVNIGSDCISGPLPDVRLATFPVHGAVSLKQSTLKADNYNQCPHIEVPALVAFYHAARGYSGTDELDLEVSFASGQKQLQHIRITVSNTPGAR
jgi:hypothetical protein